MPDSAILDVIVGLIFVFYALALICAGAVEMISTRMKKRSKYLIRGLMDLLEDSASTIVANRDRINPNFWRRQATHERSLYRVALDAGSSETGTENSQGAPGRPAIASAANSEPRGVETLQKIMGHPLVVAFKQTTPDQRVSKNPSYLPGSTFAQVVIDLLTPDPAAGTEPSFADAVNHVLPDSSSQFRQALLSLYKLSDGSVEKFTASIEAWFDAQMDGITGAYKRWAKRWAIAVAALVVIVGGVDAIAIGRTLYVDETVRAAVVQAADADALCPTGTTADECAAKAKSVVAASGVPWGFSTVLEAFGAGWAAAGLKTLGLAISIIAASLGAPFWYKVLDRVGSLRNSGNRPTTTTSSS